MFVSYLLFFVVVLTNSLKLSSKQLKFIAQLNENLAINNFILISNHSDEAYLKSMYIIKYLSEHNIQTAFMSSMQLNSSMHRLRHNTAIFKPRQLVLLDNAEQDLSTIFKIRNEFYHWKFIWIIFDADERIFQKIYIPYNCEFLNVKTVNETSYELIETYNKQVYDHNLYKLQYGTWKQDVGFEVSQLDFYIRRLNMNGSVLGFIVNFVPGRCGHPILCAYDEIMTATGHIMNFKTSYSTWAQLREIYKNGSTFIIEGSLALYVFHSLIFINDMVAPIWKTPAFLHIAYDKSYEQGYSSPYLLPFTENLWTVIGFWIISSGAVMIFTDFIAYKLKIQTRFMLINNMFLSFESFTNQCGSKIPKLLASRISLLMTRLAPWFVVPVYSAAVLSFITVKVYNIPFTDLKGLIDDGTFKIGYENGTFLSVVFNKSNDALSKTALERYVVSLNEMPKNESAGVKKLCEDHKFSFLMFNNDIYGLKDRCKLLQIPTPAVVAWDGFRLRNNSPYKNIFNRIVITLFSAGILGRMGKVAYGQKPPRKKDNDPDPVELTNILLLYNVVLGIYFVALLILAMECICVKLKNRTPKNPQQNIKE